MTYIIPAGDAVDFDLTRSPYLIPAADAVDFDLTGDGGRFGIVTRVPGVIASFGARWRRTPTARDRSTSSAFSNASPRPITRALNASQARNTPSQRIAVPHQEATPIPVIATIPYGSGRPSDKRVQSVRWQRAQNLDGASRTLRWALASLHIQPLTRLLHANATPRDVASRNLWWETDRLGRGTGASAVIWRRASAFVSPVAATINISERIPVTSNWPDLRVIDEADTVLTRTRPVDAASRALFGRGLFRDTRSSLPWGPSGSRDTTLRFVQTSYVGPIQPPGEPIPAEEKETYIIVNTVNVTRVSDGTPLDMQDITISLDTDSWAWKLAGTVIGEASMALIKPSATGLVDISVNLNGHVWVFMIEAYSRSRAHGDIRYDVQGVSRTQLLAAPYAPEASAVNTSSVLARQVIDDLLIGTGFTVGWDPLTPIWVIEEGAFSYQMSSPLAVAKRIADAAGAILLPDKSVDAFTVQPRLKVSPWALTAAPMTEIDAQIPMALVTGVAERFEPAPLYDSVYVSGTNYGVANIIERAGFGAQAPAPDVFDDLMTDTDVTRERGRQEIGASGNRGIVTLTLPIPEFITIAPGLLEPGMVVQVVEGPQQWRGYVLGTNITAPRSGAEKIEQNVQIVRLYEHE